MRKIITTLVAGAVVFTAIPGFAADKLPTTEELISALTPTPGKPIRTRGIRVAPQDGDSTAAAAPASTDSATATPAAPRTTVATAKPATRSAAPTTQSDASVNMTVNFATGSAELTPQARQALDRLGAALSSEALAGYKFRVAGHTDTVGTKELNRSLSEERAAAVVAYITAHYSVTSNRLEPVGMGADEPVVPTADQIPEPRNRRVEVINLGS